MSQPAKLSHPELAVVVLIKTFFVAAALVLFVIKAIPDYTNAVFYGVVIFFINNLVFALYVFQFSGVHSSFQMIRGFLRGVFFKLVFFALSLLVIFQLDEQSADYLQSAAIFASYFLLQFFQIVFSAFESRKL